MNLNEKEKGTLRNIWNDVGMSPIDIEKVSVELDLVLEAASASAVKSLGNIPTANKHKRKPDSNSSSLQQTQTHSEQPAEVNGEGVTATNQIKGIEQVKVEEDIPDNGSEGLSFAISKVIGNDSDSNGDEL